MTSGVIRLGRLGGGDSQGVSRGRYPIVDLPRTHPLFHTMFDLRSAADSGGRHLARQRADVGARRGQRAGSRTRHFRSNGRVMVFMTHNTDVSDSWEREGEDPGILQVLHRTDIASRSTYFSTR